MSGYAGCKKWHLTILLPGPQGAIAILGKLMKILISPDLKCKKSGD